MNEIHPLATFIYLFLFSYAELLPLRSRFPLHYSNRCDWLDGLKRVHKSGSYLSELARFCSPSTKLASQFSTLQRHRTNMQRTSKAIFVERCPTLLMRRRFFHLNWLNNWRTGSVIGTKNIPD